MERVFRMTEQALVRVILESSYDLLCSGGTALNESVGEGALSRIRDSVKGLADEIANHPEEWDRKVQDGLNKGYSTVKQTVKDILARHGITATTHSEIDGKPTIARTSKYNEEVRRMKILSEIKKRIIAKEPQYADSFADDESESGKLFKPTRHGDLYGWKCKVIGNLITLIEGLDGDDLTVVMTAMHRWGFDDSPFIEKAFFISLPVGKSA